MKWRILVEIIIVTLRKFVREFN